MPTEHDRQQGFLRLFLRHQDDLRAFVASAIRDWAAAEDVVQEVSLILWDRFDEYDDAYSFGAWARGIAANLIKREYRRHRRAPLRLSEEALHALCTAFDQAAVERAPAERQEALRACLSELGERPRRLLSLHYEEGLRQAAIAQRVRGSVEAVGKMLQRSRQALQRCVLKRLKLEGLA